jgi:ribosomal protein S18 acetylase RimI-like enzyme
MRARTRALTEHPEAYGSTPAEGVGSVEMMTERLEKAFVVGAFQGGNGRLSGIAMLACHVQPLQRLAHKCEVWSVYVEPEARGRRLSRRLMEAVITEARRLGYAWLKLGVTEGNDGALRLYESIGFEQIGYEPDYKRLGDGRSFGEIVMQMRL